MTTVAVILIITFIPVCFSLKGGSCSQLHGTEPVSYTHLDVYKRQAENCADKASGAYTGEVSAEMVASTGAKYVILGHSERCLLYTSRCV